MKSKKLFFTSLLGIILFSFFIFSGFSGDEKNKNSGFDLKNLDRSVSPGQDFYQFACGGWIKNNPIPDEYGRYGSFEVLQEENNKVLKKILESAAANKNWEKGSAEQKIGALYATGMDSARIERDGYKPLLPYLKEIDGIEDKKSFEKAIAKFHLIGIGGLFTFRIDADDKKSTVNVPQLFQSGVGLPDVEYYTKDDARSKQIREKYVQYVTNMFKLIGVDEAASGENAQTIMNIETRLAKASNTRLENRDPDKLYNKMNKEGFSNISSGFDWDVYYDELGVGNFNVLIIAQPKFFTEVGKMVNELPLDDWKVYLKWNLIRSTAGALSSSFVNEQFEFNGKFMNGTKVMQPRWKRILQTVNFGLGELLGEIYVKEVFPPEAKEKAARIVNNLLSSMGESIQNLEWMSETTKAQAIKKLNKFTVKIGYPDKWRDYSKLEIARDSHIKNMLRINQWIKQENLAKLGKPVDKQEWGITPQTVNAYYNPNNNEIVFPAAILQPPFFNPNADDAVNYGAMGVVIGHEISHGFDDQGRKFDADGNLKDWWTKEDGAKFEERAKKLADHYSGLVAIDTFKVNGPLTNGENIGDLGGLTISFNAFKKTDQFKKGESIDGFTPAQRFYLGYAQVWANNIRDEALKLRLKTDVHSPGKQRVIGPLMHLKDFIQAFDIKSGEPMKIPEDKIVKIW